MMNIRRKRCAGNLALLYMYPTNFVRALTSGRVGLVSLAVSQHSDNGDTLKLALRGAPLETINFLIKEGAGVSTDHLSYALQYRTHYVVARLLATGVSTREFPMYTTFMAAPPRVLSVIMTMSSPETAELEHTFFRYQTIHAQFEYGTNRDNVVHLLWCCRKKTYQRWTVSGIHIN